ncbi:CCA tRNA nucleotidyltransferase 1, mitochondrial-like isoform X1 [Penaeus japonicus]|uniref:CCA tRNA nucleotidyltransferase 1, mitochondrial-like isoform X1 n=2 Tax=Penaeus japonicus TaxID=27405 RepID=UPI001C716FF7|nr:CCA tRNA nucleotidyltransferase 1, mitochondrial-like isoform X1 [Penaeus japonicus]
MLARIATREFLVRKTFLHLISPSLNALVNQLHTMKLSEDQMAQVLNPEVKQLAQIFSGHGYDLRIAGGAVRDLLMGKTPHDLDFATTATPDEMKAMFDAEGVRMINAGGEKHGTVTARLEESNFECTTLRIDVETDGRHAEVEFTKDWQLDANRRDLTINAMFLGLDGTVYDFFDGSKHLNDRFVTFVGDADTRIREDYLRILRYFRFYGRIAESADSHSAKVLESIKANAEGLAKIAGERIWVELQKIITGNYGGELLVTMAECGVGPYIGFPENFDCAGVRCVYRRCQEANIPLSEVHHMTLLASGFASEEEAIKFIARVKCSKRERDLLLHVIQHRDFALQATSFKEIKDHVVDVVIGERRNKDLGLFLTGELLKYAGRVDFLENLKNWEIPRFPVNGNMIAERGVPRKQTKLANRDILEEWKKSDYSLGSEELLDTLDVKQYQ